MKIDLYVVSKPLQYLNARNIPNDFHPNHRRSLVFIKCFYKADDYINNVKKNDTSWNEIVELDSLTQFYKYLILHKVDTLIFGYDNGTLLGLICILRGIKLYILEEGVGTYMSQYPQKRCVQRWVDKVLGIGQNIGESKYTSGAFVYYPELYRKLHNTKYLTIQFSIPLAQKINEELNFLIEISEGDLSVISSLHGKKVLLYVTEWYLNNDILSEMRKQANRFDIILVKPHPHIKDLSNIDLKNMYVLKTNIMVECIYTMLINQCNELTVYHEGSSSLFYYYDMVSSVDLSIKRNTNINKLVRWEI